MGAVIKLMRVARPAASTPGPDQPRPEDFARYSHPFYWSGFAALGAVF